MNRPQIQILLNARCFLSTLIYTELLKRRGVVLTSHQILHILNRSLSPATLSLLMSLTSARKGAFASLASFIGSVMAAMAESTTSISRFRTVCPYTGHLEAAFVLL